MGESDDELKMREIYDRFFHRSLIAAGEIGKTRETAITRDEALLYLGRMTSIDRETDPISSATDLAALIMMSEKRPVVFEENVTMFMAAVNDARAKIIESPVSKA